MLSDGERCALSGRHFAEVPQLHDLDVVRAELDQPLLVLYGDQLPHRLAVLARYHLDQRIVYVIN